MPPSVGDNDWSKFDSWWRSFEQDRDLLLAPGRLRQLQGERGVRDWTTLDALWDAFTEDHELSYFGRDYRDLEAGWEAKGWTTVDTLWDEYADEIETQMVELRALVDDLRTAWTEGACQFDEDPLAANWRPESQYEGPLRTTVIEEDWSQWLAHLLRTSEGPFVQAFLDAPTRPPDSVSREIVFTDGEHMRRIDILVEYDDIGISIEVKKGDPNYGKSPETASLIEQNDERMWSHLLLIQKENATRLPHVFGEESITEEDGKLSIKSEPEIEVRFWRDVSRVLRSILLAGTEPDSHWQASAYLFTTLIEQRVLELQSFAFFEATEGGTDLSRLLALDPATQIEYLRFVSKEDHNHE